MPKCTMTEKTHLKHSTIFIADYAWCWSTQQVQINVISLAFNFKHKIAIRMRRCAEHLKQRLDLLAEDVYALCMTYMKCTCKWTMVVSPLIYCTKWIGEIQPTSEKHPVFVSVFFVVACLFHLCPMLDGCFLPSYYMDTLLYFTESNSCILCIFTPNVFFISQPQLLCVVS